MASQYPDRMELLGKENYETWKIHMESILIMNDAWEYVSGEKTKPEEVRGNAETTEAVRLWEKEDKKAKAKILLAIKASELKQVKDCVTSRDVWQKLKSIYQSSGPARKATMLKQLARHKMGDNEDARDHLRKFFDTTDKLREMDINIPLDLLSVLLMNSLPSSFENFRCAIESRDELPNPETLRVKIIEEFDARKEDTGDTTTRAMLVKGQNARQSTSRRNYSKSKEPLKGESKSKREPFKFKCYRCGKNGHKARDCKEPEKNNDDANTVEAASLCAIPQALNMNKVLDEDYWCLDSGCTAHMCNDKIISLEEVHESGDARVNLACKETSAPILGKGQVTILTKMKGRTNKLSVRDVLRVPELRTNLLSVGKITDRGYRVIFDKSKAEVIDNVNRSILTAHRKDGLYYIRDSRNQQETSVNLVNEVKNFDTVELWHRKMGHLNIQDLVRSHRDKCIKGMNLRDINEDFQCEICISSKMTRMPFPKSSTQATKILEIIHSDICGPMRVESNGKARYVATFIDDYSRWCEIRLLKRKNEVLNAFKDFKAMAENRHGKRILYLQTDNGKEYRNEAFDAFLRENGISRRLTVTHTPEQNGVAERRNRTLLDMTRCLLMQSQLPESFWGEAINTANYIRNRCPSKSLKGRTAFERWTGSIPDVSHFEPFGTKVYTLNRDPTKGKLDSRSVKGILVGYSEESKGFRIWLPDKKRVDVARDVRFVKNHGDQPRLRTYDDILLKEDDKDEEREENEVIFFPSTHTNIDISGDEAAQSESDSDESQHEIEPEEHNARDEQRRGPGRPKILRTGLRGRPRKQYHIQDAANLAEEELFLAEISLVDAMRGEQSGEWIQAITTEMKSILKNETWTITDRPADRNIIGSRIVLRNKYKQDGTIERRKARIVAKGFAQRPGIDFKESFAPVARLGSIRAIIALAAEKEMKVHHFDVATAFLNGKLDEEVYMEIPEYTTEALREIVSTKHTDDVIRRKASKMLKQLEGGDKVCLLKKAIYGLRQAGRCWNDRIDKEVREFGARKSTADSCVYIKGNGDDLMIIALYVDDILVASKSEKQISNFGRFLASKFELTCLGKIKHCLGMEFLSKNGEISIKQSGYIRDILERFGMAESKKVSTPLEPGINLMKSEGESNSEERSIPYRELIGALMYWSVCTRPDISYAVSYLSQFSNRYKREHWIAAKRVLRYLSGTQELGLTYKKTGKSILGFVDADWANCPNDRKSYTGYAFILGGCPISWESRKQRTVALSSTEAEYMALSEASKEGVYLRHFLSDLGFESLTQVCIKCDNNGARKLAENPVFHGRSKHIDVRHHFVREVLKNEELVIEYASTNEMAADILTKGVSKQKHMKCLELLGILKKTESVNETSPNRGGVLD